MRDGFILLSVDRSWVVSGDTLRYLAKLVSFFDVNVLKQYVEFGHYSMNKFSSVMTDTYLMA